MLKKHMAACLVASAFITMPVLAQTSTSPGETGARPPATGAASGAGGGAGAATSPGGAASGRFITQQQQTQWRASRLIGINVYGADNDRIGDINEVLVDRNGNADAVVIGVGGFLGIGEKNVALPFNAFEWQMEARTASAGGSGSGAGTGGSGSAARTGDTAATGAGTGAGAGTSGAGGTAAGRDTAGTTASTSAAGSGSGARSGGGSDRGYPDHAVLKMSKADLENAPAFRYVGDRSSDAGSSGGSAGRGSGSGTGGSGAGAGGGAGAGSGAGAGGTAPRQ